MISSVGDFLNVVNEIYPHKENVFFRGVSSHKHNIVSSLCRVINDNGLNDSATEVAEELFENFKNKLPSYPEFSTLKNYNVNDIDVLMTAQHYGTPTRLIDLTTNPLVALYFAVESYKEKEEKKEEKKEEDKISVYVVKDTAEKKIKLKSSDSILTGFKTEEKNIRNFANIAFEKNIAIGCSQSPSALLSTDNRINGELTEIKKYLNKILLEEEFFSYSNKYLLPTCADEHKNYKDAFDFLSNEVSSILDNKESVLGQCNCLSNKIYGYLATWSSNQNLNPVARELYGSDFFVIEPLPVNNRIKNQQGFFLFSKK